LGNAGFKADSADGISVPEPIGVISKFRMWFQRKVPGVTADERLAGPDGIALAGRIADAIHKVHCAGVRSEKAHTIEDELKILRECLAQVSVVKPAWSERLQKLMRACERVAAAAPVPAPCGIHRDFYSSQVIVDEARLWLIDFDLYCQGDPALDVGNFIGHITEQALRQRASPEAFVEVESALMDRFAQLSGQPADTRIAVCVYTNLTLVRHIFLSTKFPERQHLTEKLLQLCECRLGVDS
jgi:phosphotransferase family enzyme